MRVAALYDIHGNLPALETVLEEVRQTRVDRIVVGGDVIPGPMPAETLSFLSSLDLPVDFIYGNGERAVIAQLDAASSASVTYWGTASGEPPPEAVREVLRWTARDLGSRHAQTIRTWAGTLALEIPGIGPVLFCHGTPRSETETFTRDTPEERLVPVFAGTVEGIVICGHTHMQFDRVISRTRVANAGSVGMPFGKPGAHWLLLDSAGMHFRHTPYDLTRAAERVRSTRYPQAEAFASSSILRPPAEDDMRRALTSVSFA